MQRFRTFVVSLVTCLMWFGLEAAVPAADPAAPVPAPVTFVRRQGTQFVHNETPFFAPRISGDTNTFRRPGDKIGSWHRIFLTLGR